MNRGRQRAQWRHRLRQQSIAYTEPSTARIRNLPSVQLRIDELVFRGFPNLSTRRIVSEFEREMTALMQTRNLPSAWLDGVHIDRARTMPLRVGSLGDVRSIGEQLAHAIFGLEAKT